MSTNATAQQGHPKGLMTLFFSEMWERFCYYGMRVLLTLYLVKSLMKGDAEASLIYGAYTALIYAAPVLGGKMADKYLGYRYAIMFGAVLMAIGEFLILGGNESFMLLGMGALIVGNGYFKANISTIVGKLYEDDDPRRDSGFTIFYIGINIGALLATTVVAYVGETVSFEAGFGLAGAGMLLGLLIFWFGRDNYSAAEGLDIQEAGRKKLFGIQTYQVISLASLLLIPLCYVLISQSSILAILLTILFLIVAYNLINAGIKEGPVWRDRMIALVIFMIINVVFWAFFEQAGTSLTLFADRNIDREILGWTMPASMTQFFNPAFIILFGSLFSMMWLKLSAIGKNPSVPMKFALGILQLGLGFLVARFAFEMGSSEIKVPLLTLVFLYMLHTTGELFLSPIGLSLVTKLSPKSMSGTAMGGWFLSFAIANFLGGQIASMTGSEGHGGESEESFIESLFPSAPEYGEDEYTVFQAIEELGDSTITKENWVELNTVANSSIGQFNELNSWVEFRQAYEQNVSFKDWVIASATSNNHTSIQEWLNRDMWETLNEDASIIKKADNKLKVEGVEKELMSLKEEIDDLKKSNDELNCSVNILNTKLENPDSTIDNSVCKIEDIVEFKGNTNLDPGAWKYFKSDFDNVSVVLLQDMESKKEDKVKVDGAKGDTVNVTAAHVLDVLVPKEFARLTEESNKMLESSIQDVYAAHEQDTLKKGLVKYTGIFTNIGLLLLGFSLLIALFSKPLNKLMHGVK